MTDKKTVIQALGYGFGNKVCDNHTFRFGDMPESYNVTRLMGDALEVILSNEPHVLTLEQASGRDYCFYEYRATGYVEPASVVISGKMLCDAVPLAEIYRLGREGAACVAVSEYGRTWRCWDRMPEDGQKEDEPWDK